MSMKLIKGFIIAIVGLFVFISILSLFIPSRVLITRGVVINAYAAKVLAQVSDLQKWKNWQPVFKNDSAKISFTRDLNGESKSCEWISGGKKNIITITGETKNTVNASLAREGENAVLNTIKILPLADSNQVQAEWNVQIKLNWYPWEKFSGIFIEKITGQGYEDALNSLKDYCEKH